MLSSLLHPSRRPFVILAVLYSSVLFTSTAVQHYLMGSQVWDLGIFEQFNWLIANGKINTISSLRNITPLQDHFSLLLLPIALVYKLSPNAYTLFALQSLALGCMPALAADLCLRQGVKRELIWALAIAIVLSPYSFLVNRGDFHPDVLTLPLMLVAIREVDQPRRWLYYPCLLLTLFAKNAQALFGIGLSFYALAKGQRARAAITLAISMAWWSLATHMSSAGGDHVGIRLGYLGDTKLEMLTTLITRPWVVFNEAPPDSILLYSLGLSLPFLALFGRASWKALLGCTPIYFTNLISASSIQRELNHHYSIGILAFLIGGCIDALAQANPPSLQRAKTILYATLLFSTAALLGYGRLGYYQSRLLPRLQEAQDFQAAKQIIQPNDSVLTIANYAAHMAGRQMVKQIEKPGYGAVDQYDWIVLPAPDIPINIAGKLKRVDRTKLGPNVARVRREAEAAQMNCRSANASIVLCSRS